MQLIAGQHIISIEKKEDLIQPLDSGELLSGIFGFLNQWFDDTDFISMQTSGSTGTPKTIELPKKTMLESAKMTNAFFNLNEKSVSLLCLPSSYIAGKMMLVRAFAGNYSLIPVNPSSNPFAGLKAEDWYQNFPLIDFTAITPHQLLNSTCDLPHLNIRNIIVGGSQVTSEIEKLTANWPAAMFETFGMTETASHIALRRFNGYNKAEYFEVLNGVKIMQDEHDCLQIEAPRLFEGILTTRDIVSIEGPDKFVWLGRFDHVINSGGIKIFPEQIEKKIQGLIDRPFYISWETDPKLGMNVILLIEETALFPSEENNIKEKDFNESILQGVSKARLHPQKSGILDVLKSALKKYELPKEIYAVPAFNRSNTGKIIRQKSGYPDKLKK